MSDAEKTAISATKKIDMKNKSDFKNESRKIKLLLLGAGESGKSTIFKQMKILYGDHGFTLDERQRMSVTIYGNILQNLKMVLKYCQATEPIEGDLGGKVETFLKLSDGKDAAISPAIATQLKEFWSNASVQSIWERRAEFQVQDALEYYMENIDRIGANDYVPNEQDVLRARVRTSGIIEEAYSIDKVPFVMFDVGGQRNERKKWIHCFDNVTAVIFVAAINEYNQVLYEDSTMNRMDEAVILFDEICNNVYFKRTAMILFLNKKDLFEEKLAKVAFRVDEGPESRYTDFEGPFVVQGKDSAVAGSSAFKKCSDATTNYILKLFINRNQDKKRTVYSHVTCATDTKNVDVVFNSCKDIMLQQSLLISGFGPAE